MKKEIIFASMIIGYLLVVFSLVVAEYEIKNQNYEAQPIQMVELHGNGTVRNFEIENSSKPNLLTSIAVTLSRFAFALPFILGGIGIWGVPLGIIYGDFFTLSETQYFVLIFWIASIASIPVTAFFSKKIPKWKRIPLIYLIAVLIGGTPILFSSTFGQ